MDDHLGDVFRMLMAEQQQPAQQVGDFIPGRLPKAQPGGFNPHNNPDLKTFALPLLPGWGKGGGPSIVPSQNPRYPFQHPGDE